MIGAGSVVVDDIPDGVVAFGNKCVVRHKNEFRVLCKCANRKDRMSKELFVRMKNDLPLSGAYVR